MNAGTFVRMTSWQETVFLEILVGLVIIIRLSRS